MFEIDTLAIATIEANTDAVIAPAADALLSDSILSDLSTFLPETLSEIDLTQFADSLLGAVTFTDGVIGIDLMSTGGAIAEEIDAVAEIGSLIDELTGITATVGLEGGIVTTGLTLEDGEAMTGTLDLNALVETALLPAVADIEGSLTINGGIIDVDLDIGDSAIEGALSFLDGALDIDLDTPFGDLEESFAFDEDTEFTVPLGDSTATFNLFAGTATLNPDTDSPAVFDLADLPITLAIDDGLATVELIGITTIGEPFDVTEIISSAITPLITGAAAEFTLSGGVLEGFFELDAADEPVAPEAPVDPMVPETPVDVIPPEAPVDPTLPETPVEIPVDPTLPETPVEAMPEADAPPISVDLAQLLTDASDFIASLSGTLAFSGGTAVSDLVSTPIESDPIEGEPPIEGDPTGDDPTGGDPIEGDPTGGDPIEGDPIGSEPIDLSGETDLIELAETISTAVAFLEMLDLIEIDAPAVEGPDAEDPGTEDPGAEGPGEDSGAEDPGAEDPGAETPDMEAPDTDSPVDEPAVEEPTVEAPAMEAPAVETPGEEPETPDPSGPEEIPTAIALFDLFSLLEVA